MTACRNLATCTAWRLESFSPKNLYRAFLWAPLFRWRLDSECSNIPTPQLCFSTASKDPMLTSTVNLLPSALSLFHYIKRLLEGTQCSYFLYTLLGLDLIYSRHFTSTRRSRAQFFQLRLLLAHLLLTLPPPPYLPHPSPHPFPHQTYTLRGTGNEEGGRERRRRERMRKIFMIDLHTRLLSSTLRYLGESMQ